MKRKDLQMKDLGINKDINANAMEEFRTLAGMYFAGDDGVDTARLRLLAERYAGEDSDALLISQMLALPDIMSDIVADEYAGSMPEDFVARMEENISTLASAEAAIRQQRTWRRRLGVWGAAAGIAMLLGAGIFVLSREHASEDASPGGPAGIAAVVTSKTDASESVEQGDESPYSFKTVVTEVSRQPERKVAQAGRIVSTVKTAAATVKTAAVKMAAAAVESPTPQQIDEAKATLEDCFQMLSMAVEQANDDCVETIESIDIDKKIMKL